MKKIINLLIIGGLLSFSLGWGRPISSENKFLLGTEIKITVIDHNSQRAQEGIEEAFKEIERLEKLMSVYQKNSNISYLNRIGGEEWVEVSPEVLEVLEEAKHISVLTKGAFDITIAPLTKLWKTAREKKQFPSSSEIKRKKGLVDYTNLVIDRKRRKVKFKKKGMEIDLGGIAKGYCIDKAIKILQDKGIKQATVNAGGDLRTLGRKSLFESWKVGIQHPRKNKSMFAILKIENKAVVTSGDYQRYSLIKGERIHHIIDPRTGYPAKDSLSVTLIAKGAMKTDALATAIFVLGPSKGLKLIEHLDEVEGIIIGKDTKIFLSSGLKKLKYKW